MTRRRTIRLFVTLGLALAIGLGTAVSPYAASSPDGLEQVARKQGFLEQGRLHRVQRESPIPDYAFPGIDDPRVATGVAGFVGTLAVFAIGSGVAFVVTRRRRGRSPLSTGAA